MLWRSQSYRVTLLGRAALYMEFSRKHRQAPGWPGEQTNIVGTKKGTGKAWFDPGPVTAENNWWQHEEGQWPNCPNVQAAWQRTLLDFITCLAFLPGELKKKKDSCWEVRILDLVTWTAKGQKQILVFSLSGHLLKIFWDWHSITLIFTATRFLFLKTPARSDKRKKKSFSNRQFPLYTEKLKNPRRIQIISKLRYAEHKSI